MDGNNVIDDYMQTACISLNIAQDLDVFQTHETNQLPQAIAHGPVVGCINASIYISIMYVYVYIRMISEKSVGRMYAVNPDCFQFIFNYCVEERKCS